MLGREFHHLAIASDKSNRGATDITKAPKAFTLDIERWIELGLQIGATSDAVEEGFGVSFLGGAVP